MLTPPCLVVQLLNCVRLFVTPWTAGSQASLSFSISQSFLKLMSNKSVMPSNYFFLCCTRLLLRSIFPASGSFPMSCLFSSGGQCIGASASASILPMNIQGWFHLGLTSLISLQYEGLARVFFNTKVQKASILQHSAFIMVQLSHPYMTTGKKKTQLLLYGPLFAK